VIKYKLSGINIDNAVLDHELHSPGSKLGLYMISKAALHVAASKALVGKGTGRLQSTISFEHSRRRSYQRITIIADTRYAYYHHEGTKPHFIRAKRGKVLKFRSAGRTINRAVVKHPGTPPNPYLTAPLRTIWK
jgi:hypothetical protein